MRQLRERRYGNHAAGGRLKGKDGIAVFIDIRVGATENATRYSTSQAINASVAHIEARPIAVEVQTTQCVGQRTEIIVERIFFRHHDDDVVDLLQIAVSERELRRQQH